MSAMKEEFLNKVKENGYYRFYTVEVWENGDFGDDVFLPCLEDSIPECAIYQKTEKTENTVTEIWKGISGKTYHVMYYKVNEEELKSLKEEED